MKTQLHWLPADFEPGGSTSAAPFLALTPRPQQADWDGGMVCPPGVLILPFISPAALQELQLDSDPGVRRAALDTLQILDTCSQHRLSAPPEGVS